MLLEALVGCAGVTLAAVATAMGIELKSALVSAEGDLDFRGTLGVDRDALVGFSRIRLLSTSIPRRLQTKCESWWRSPSVTASCSKPCAKHQRSKCARSWTRFAHSILGLRLTTHLLLR